MRPNWTKEENQFIREECLRHPEKASHEIAAYLVGNRVMRNRSFGAIYQHIEWLKRKEHQAAVNE